MARRHKPFLIGDLLVDVPQEAQGFRIIPRESGTRDAYWYASDAAVSKGYLPKTVRLHGSLDVIDDVERMFGRCSALRQEMTEWLATGKAAFQRKYDGTVASLIECWQTDPGSTFHENRLSTQETYTNQAKPTVALLGKRAVASLTGADLRAAHRTLYAPAKPGEHRRERRAIAAMDVLRDATRYGAEAGHLDCVGLLTVLEGMVFRVDRSETVEHLPRPKKVAMGFEFAEAIVRKGLATGTPRGRAVALGVAAQFEFTLRQIDVIGYFVARNRTVMEPGMLALGTKAWKPGLRFEDFATGVLDLSTTKNNTDAVFDVAEYPLFQLALAAVPIAERVGPLVSVRPGEPVRKRFYSTMYNEVREAASVPETVWNARARHGGISEGQSSGADIVDVSKHAQHTDLATTVRNYVVPDLDTSRRVARSRVAKRAKDAAG